MWLLDDSVRKKMEQAHAMGVTISAEQQQKFEARFGAEGSEMGARILTLAGNTAEIAVQGVLTKSPDIMAMLFGGGNTTYGEIIAAIAQAENDENIQDTVFAYESPGGGVDGMFDTMAAIAAMKKPTKAVVGWQAASAAFGLASQADKIVATGKASMIGSVGIMASIYVDDETVVLTSTNAPDKAPDPKTAEGKAVITAQLDALHDLFVEGIAEGRGTTVDDVNANFGRGATILAEDAMNRGMIDSIAGVAPALKVVEKPKEKTAKSGITTEARNMDLMKLKTEHPDVYAAAVKEGTDQERSRVNAHLTWAAHGCTEIAMKAIAEGKSATDQELMAQYQTGMLAASDLKNRDDDDADPGNPKKPDADAVAKQVANSVCAQLGVKVEV